MSSITVKKGRANTVLAIHITSKSILITNKTECFSFKSRHDRYVVRHVKENWPTMFTIIIPLAKPILEYKVVQTYYLSVHALLHVCALSNARL